jgi:hypothetical protein
MKDRLLIFLILFFLLSLSTVECFADIVILKNGQMIEDVTIKDEGDVLYCESSDRSFYINKDTVQSIVRTGEKGLLKQAKEFIASVPDKTRLFVKDYFSLVATIICILILLLGLLVFKFLWLNIKSVFTSDLKRRDIIRSVKQLDSDEKSVLREFTFQASNTIEMPVEDVVISGMIKKGILVTTREKGEYSACGLMLPVVISPVAKKRITKKRIDLPKNMTDKKARDTLARTRPPFMYKLAGFYQALEKKGRT